MKITSVAASEPAPELLSFSILIASRINIDLLMRTTLFIHCSVHRCLPHNAPHAMYTQEQGRYVIPLHL